MQGFKKPKKVFPSFAKKLVYFRDISKIFDLPKVCKIVTIYFQIIVPKILILIPYILFGNFHPVLQIFGMRLGFNIEF